MINTTTFHQQNGSSLLEVLVALLVLGIGILGVLAMQSEALKFNKQAYSYTQAMFLANDMMERIRANKDAIYTTGDALGETATTQCDAAACSEDDLRAWDIAQWGDNLEALLPGAQGEVSENNGIYTITVGFSINDKSTEEKDFYYLVSGV